jgi:hypothetical protein
MKRDSDGNSNKAKGKANGRFNDVTFINWTLTTEQKAAVKAWTPTVEEIDDLLTETVEEGCKVTFGYDERGSSFLCSIVPQPSHKLNHGFILVGRGSTALKSFKQALYIHRQVFNGNWSTYSKADLSETLDD